MATSAGDLDLPGGGGKAQQEQPQAEGDKLGGCLTTLEDLANKVRAGNGVDIGDASENAAVLKDTVRKIRDILSEDGDTEGSEEGLDNPRQFFRIIQRPSPKEETDVALQDVYVRS